MNTIRESEFARKSLKASFKTLKREKRRRRREDCRRGTKQEDASPVEIDSATASEEERDEKSAMLFQVYDKVEKRNVE